MQAVIDLLGQAAQQFRDYNSTAQNFLSERDAVTFASIHEKKANLLMDLPDKVAPLLQGLDKDIQERILTYLLHFASEAIDALEMDGTSSLETLLVRKGDKAGDPNNLDRLIISMKEEM